MRYLLVFALSFLAIAFLPAQESRAIIKPGDKVTVVCEEEPTLNREYLITRDGLIVLPFIGAVEVAGLTEAQASERIAKRLVDERIVVAATVRVTLGIADSLPVRFRGAVKNAGETPWQGGLRVSDVIKIAEPTDAADLAAIELTTATGQKFVVNTLGRGLLPPEDPLLKPGDSLFFPIARSRSEVFVLGAVGKPGSVEFTEGMTVRQAIEAAGGFVGQSDRANVRVEAPGVSVEVVDLSHDDADLRLRSGDRVTVGMMSRTLTVRVQGEANRPGVLTYKDRMTLGQAIHEAGGFTRRARQDRAVVIRTVDGKRTEIVGNPDHIYKGLAGDVPLEPGDTIVLSAAGSRRGIKVEAILGAALMFFLINR